MPPNATVPPAIPNPPALNAPPPSQARGIHLSELLNLNEKATLSINFNKQGRHYNVYMSSDSESEKLRTVIESQKTEIAYLKEIVALLKKTSTNL